MVVDGGTQMFPYVTLIAMPAQVPVTKMVTYSLQIQEGSIAVPAVGILSLRLTEGQT